MHQVTALSVVTCLEGDGEAPGQVKELMAVIEGQLATFMAVLPVNAACPEYK